MSDKAKILVVDDNPMNLEVLIEALDDRYDVALAEEGTTALEIAPSFQPDVVLLDVMMPGRDGFDVCRAMKGHSALRNTRIIMVSARAELSARLKGYDCGADDYVTKPFCEEELMTKVEFALRTKRLQGLCGATGEVLALVSELRDTDCDPILESIRSLSLCLATAMKDGVYGAQIDQRFLDDLEHASVLRDVGMLAVPEVILDKAGNWTSAERDQLKEHTLVGAGLMNRLAAEHPGHSVFRMAAQVARSHHERFDGKGYPDGLAGGDIALAARIVSVAEAIRNSIDTSAGLVDKAVTQLFADNVTQFDPIVTTAVSAAIHNWCDDVNLDGFITARSVNVG